MRQRYVANRVNTLHTPPLLDSFDSRMKKVTTTISNIHLGTQFIIHRAGARQIHDLVIPSITIPIETNDRRNHIGSKIAYSLYP